MPGLIVYQARTNKGRPRVDGRELRNASGLARSGGPNIWSVLYVLRGLRFLCSKSALGNQLDPGDVRPQRICGASHREFVFVFGSMDDRMLRHGM